MEESATNQAYLVRRAHAPDLGEGALREHILMIAAQTACHCCTFKFDKSLLAGFAPCLWQFWMTAPERSGRAIDGVRVIEITWSR